MEESHNEQAQNNQIGNNSNIGDIGKNAAAAQGKGSTAISGFNNSVVNNYYNIMQAPSPATLPQLGPEERARIFIGYKRHTTNNLDQQLAVFLKEFLSQQGHQVFIDLQLRSGQSWLEEIDNQIKQADFFIAILSEESVDSEMLQSEVQRAATHRKATTGRPFVIPIRLNYSEILPYAIDAFLNPFQYVVCNEPTAFPTVAAEILGAIRGELSEKEPHLPIEAGETPSADTEIKQPSPTYDPRILKRLRAPGGAVRLNDPFYVERAEDEQLFEAITAWGETITIQAPRQLGKTSTLVRAINHADQEGLRSVFLDFQAIGPEPLQNKDDFILLLAQKVCDELGIAPDRLDQLWDRRLNSQEKLTTLFHEIVLPEIDDPLILAIDEADELLKTDYYLDFFALLRSWHNRRARPRNEHWEKLNIVLVISTEPYLLIDNIHQSPFNVGERFNLNDLNEDEIGWLNEAHGSPVGTADFEKAKTLLGGQPYLWRKLLYEMVKRKHNYDQIESQATDDQGPFGDHLRRHLWALKDNVGLEQVFKQIIQHGRADDKAAKYRLKRAGLTVETDNGVKPRSELYARYFGKELT